MQRVDAWPGPYCQFRTGKSDLTLTRILADRVRDMTGFRSGVAVIALGVLVLARCDSKRSPSQPKLSARELANRANALCARYRIAHRGGRSLKTREEVLRYLDRTRPVQRRQEREDDLPHQSPNLLAR